MTATSNMVKVTIPLPLGEWHGYLAETVWASRCADAYNHLQLENVPFAAKGMSFGDILEVAAQDGEVVFQRVVRKSGHSTYRVIPNSMDAPDFQTFLASLNQNRCSYETGTIGEDEVVAIDVECAEAASALYSRMEAGEAAGLFDFEEADYCPSERIVVK